MPSFNVAAETLTSGDFIYDKSVTVTEVILEGTSVVVSGTRGGTGKSEVHTYESGRAIWIHRTHHFFEEVRQGAVAQAGRALD